jgi:autotransporter-associated beta strand protein
MAATCISGVSSRKHLLLIWFALILSVSSNLPAAPNDLPPGFPLVQLPAKAKGEAAIQALGNKLPAIAAFYRVSEQQLKNLLRRDKTLWVDPRGQLFYVCDWEVDPKNIVPTQNVVTPLALVAPYDKTFTLHSRPGASKIIYLDFDGHDASATSWGTDAIARPFDTDGNPSSFSNSERDVIQNAWQYVAEDFSIYDVDVTTEDPGVEALRKANTSDANYGIRVVIGGSSSDWYGSAGGVAYVGSFDSSSDLPCWVFPKSLADNAKYIGEAISHETGHTLSLNHDGKDLNGVHTEYYSGQGNWAPIMGVGYYEPISQWSRGEYANANNLQDDLTAMLSRGISYRSDDHGNTNATATPLVGILFSTNGVIERTNDLDFFSFQTGAGKVSLTATPWALGPNLHLYLSLYDGTGTLITSTNSTDTSSGVQPVTLTATVPTGTYYLCVDGIGDGAPSTNGYSDFGSLGQYTITGTLPAGSGWLPTPGGSYVWSALGNWASNTVPNAAEASARCTNNIAGDQTISLDFPVTIGRLLLGDSDSSHSFNLVNGPGGSLNFQSTSGAAVISKIAGAIDTISSAFALRSDLVVTNASSADLVLSGTISGTNHVVKRGPGKVVMSGTNLYTGTTVIGGGTLDLSNSGSIASSPKIDIQAGATLNASSLAGGFMLNNQSLSGTGVLIGDVSTANNTQLLPGTNGVAGTQTFSNNLTLNGGTKLKVDLGASVTPGGGTNDLLVVLGNLTLNGTIAVEFNFLSSAPASPGTYTLIQYSGALIGSASNLVSINSDRYSFLFDDSVPGVIRVHVSGVPAGLIWQGDGAANAWNIGSALNWLNGVTPTSFLQLDTVTFNDAGSSSPAINLSGTLNPSTINVTSSKAYSFSGTGKLSGAASLNKSGTGSLTINTANDYSGSTVVTGGTLKAGQSSALGDATGNTVISNGGTLDVNAINLGGEPVTIAGAGVGSNGALINGITTAQSNALRFVTLSGDSTFGGTGRWDIRANPTGSLTGNGYNLNKTGTNDIWFSNLGSSGLGDINLDQGTLVFQGTTTMGDSTKNITVASNAVLAIASSDINVLNKKLVMNGGATLRNDAGNNLFLGIATLQGTNTFNVSFTLEMQGVIGGTGTLVKTGTGTLSLSANNTFTGTNIVSNGTLRARSPQALGNTNAGTVIVAGARLDLNSQNLGAEPITVGGTGLGTGGAIINNGTSAQLNALRFVTLSGNTTLGGISRWDLRANPTASLVGNNFNLTKVGPNEIWLSDVGSSGLGNITITEGLLGLQTNTTLGNPTNTLTINSGSSLGLSVTGTNLLSKVLNMSAGRIYNVLGSNSLAGVTTLTASNTFDIAGGTDLTLSGNMSGSGSLNKFGTGSLVLTGTNVFTGYTYLNAGVIQVGNGGVSGAIGTGPVTNDAQIVFFRTNDFAFTNAVYGTGSMVKKGAGIVTLSGSNSYNGLTTISAGTLKVGSSSALGMTNFGTVIGNSATLDLNGFSIGEETLTSVQGLGVAEHGAIINTGSAQTNAIRWLTLTGNTVFGGTGRWDIRGPIGGNNGFSGQGFTLSKTGNNQIWLANLGNVNLGDIFIDAGLLGFEGSTFPGNPAKTVRVSGATLGIFGTGTNLDKVWVFSDGTLSNAAGANTLNGTVSLSGVNLFNISSGSSLAMNGPCSNTGSLTKTGTGTLVLNVNNSYTGKTIINAGTLTVSSSAAIGSSISVQVDAGAVLDGASAGGLVINSGRTLLGNGTVSGNTTVNGTLSPGITIGRLSFQHSLILAGTTALDVSHTGPLLTNDSVSVLGALTLGGSLIITNTGSSLGAGDTFQLFQAGTLSGTFSNLVLPTLNASLVWNTNNLTSNGSISIVSLVAPKISAAATSGANLSLSLQSQSGVTYVLQTATNLNDPIFWTPIGTNIGDGGILSVPVAIATNEIERVFRFKVN